jgi:hypothetical protein
MIEAGEVGAVFRIVDEASPVLREIAAQFERMEKVVQSAKASFDTLRLPPGLAASISKMEKSFSALAGSADKGAAGAMAALGKIDTSVGATQERVAALSRELAAVGARTKEVSALAGRGAFVNTPAGWVPIGGGHGGGAHGGGGGHHGNFRIGGGIPIEAPGGGKMHVSAGGPGFWTLLTGLAFGEATKKFLEGGFELRHQMVMVQSATADAAIQAAVLGKAWQEAGSNLNSTVVGNIQNVMELNKATGNWTESMKLLHTFNVAEAALGSVKDQKLKETLADSSQTLNFARGLEELGATSRGATPAARDAETKRYANDLLRTMIWSRGRFDGNMLFGATNNSGGMAQNWDERFATTIAPIMALEMKGSKLGNMDYMSIKSLVGGHITPGNVAALLKNKIISRDETFTDKFGMHLKPNSPDMIKLMTNPWDWANDELAAMKKRGVDVGNQKVMADIVTELANSKTLSTGLRMLLEPAAHALIAKDIAMRDLVPPDAASVLMANDPGKKLEAVGAKWSDLMASLGSPITDKALAGLTHLAEALSGTAQFFNSHPKAATLAADATADSAALFTVGGALMMTKIFSRAFGWLKGGAAAAVEAGPSMLSGMLRGGVIGGGAYVVGKQLLDALLPQDELMKKEQDYISSFGAIKHLFGGPADPIELDWLARHPAGVPSRFHFLTGDEESRVFHSDPTAERHAWSHSYDGQTPRAPAPANVAVKVNVTVSGDLKGLINAVVSSVTSEFVHGPASHDDHAHFASPDLASGIGAH